MDNVPRLNTGSISPRVEDTSNASYRSPFVRRSEKMSMAAGPTVDPNVPILYQSIKAEIQNLLDKMTNAQYQDVVESANKIRENALQLKGTPKPEVPSPRDEYSYIGSELEANDLISQITLRRQQELEMLKNIPGRTDIMSLKRKISPVPQKLSQIENLNKDLDQAERGMAPIDLEPVLTAELHDTIRKITKAPEQMIRSILEDASREDHLVPLEDLEEKYCTTRSQGLSQQQVLIHRQRDGLNILKQQKTTPEWLVYLKTLVAGFGLILWAAVILCFLAYWPLGDPPDVYNLVLGFVILAVIFVQGTFSYIQERKASNLIASFTKMMPSNCQVLRQGGWNSVTAADLVVGDIIRVREGDKLPADIRVFETSEGKVEKSSLTGESEPIPLSDKPTDRNIYETHNMALFGTSMTEGACVGIVVNTGDRTVMGKIAQMASTTKSATTSLQKEITYFMLMIVTLAVIVCLVVLLGYFLGIKKAHPKFLSVATMVTNCIAITVALLPDGLPIAITTILTLVGKRLHEEMILVKKLTVTETLGSATLIASDKTGTITTNQMILNHIWIMNGTPTNRKASIVFEDGKVEDRLEKLLPGCFKLANMGNTVVHPSLAYLLQVMCLCNKSNFEQMPDAKNKPNARYALKKIVGNPTEGAMLTAADNYFEAEQLRLKVPIVDEIPFSSRRKFHLTLHKVSDMSVFVNSERVFHMYETMDSYHYIILVKGAPEYILSMCTTAVINNEQVVSDSHLVAQIMQANELLAMEGERVIAFAFKRLPANQYPLGTKFDMKDESLLTTDLCFVGLTGIIDPPRPGVADAIMECHNAGIRVMMVTGDHPTTAVAISRMVNIITKPIVKTIEDVNKLKVESTSDVSPTDQIFKKAAKMIFQNNKKRVFIPEAIVITGMDIASLSKPQWDFVLSHREVVFARTTPQHKLQIVKESQQRGDVIAVTGDGVNDAPALKAANLGVAMGICGSDVSKEAANMVLLDDNFVTIVRGVKEGRLLFDNLKKVICYLLPAGSYSEILPVLAWVFLGMPQPLSAFLMIVICVGTDMIGSLGLVHEMAESDIMNRPPRNAKTDRLVNFKVILFTYCFIGTLESIIAFFMYFLTMYLGNVPPSKLMFSYENWESDFNVTLSGKDYFVSAATQKELNLEAQTAFFVSLVVTQLWNLLSVRTRLQSSLIQKFDPRLLWYMFGEIVIMLFICYLPVVNNYMGTRPVKYYHFLIPAALGSIIFGLDELRKYIARRWPNSIIRKLAW